MLLVLRGIVRVLFFTALACASAEARALKVSYSSPEPGGILDSCSAQYVIRFDGWVDNRAFQLDVTRTEGRLIGGPRFARRSGHCCPRTTSWPVSTPLTQEAVPACGQLPPIVNVRSVGADENA
jgi:hypothetical protein